MNAVLMENKPRKKIKVALVAPSMKDVGGQSIQAKRLLDAFNRDENIEIEFIANNPETRFQKIKFLRTVFSSVKFWSQILRKFSRNEIVHVFSSGTTSYIISTLPPLVAAKLFNKKTILHYHTGEAEEHLKNWRLSARPTMKKFDEIVVPSQFLVDIFKTFGLQAKAIFNFIDTEQFAFRERKPLRPVFLSNRNFEAYYNVGCVLKAFQLIQKKIPQAELIVAGYGRGEFELRKLAKELNLERVEFVGRIEQAEMPKIYDQADIFLNASLVDNMPLSVIEAFACGLPVVSSKTGGIPYIVEHEKNGLLVEQNDCEALANEAMRLLQNDNLAQEIILNAVLECEKYKGENVRGEWLSIYRKLAE